jgi:Recombination endonuclease VII
MPTPAAKRANKKYKKSTKGKATRRAWDKAHPRSTEHRRVEHLKARATVAGREAHRRSNRKSRLKREYGMTPEEWDALLIEQNGVCAICREAPSRDNSLGVDHCHVTNRRRGLLCRCCNLALGNMRDNAARLRAGADYLEKHSL